MEMEKEKIKTGLVLPGGGARGAYQIGVLKAIAELLPEKRNNPFYSEIVMNDILLRKCLFFVSKYFSIY